jgi:type I restriction enzyme M protein
VPIEVLGLEQAARFLRPGGRLAIVLPDGVLGNNRTLNARRWAVGFLAIRAIVSLPVEAFSPFGANVKTSVLFARRLMPGEAQNDRSNVFLAQVDHVGCDASGRPHGVDELPKVTEALCAFLAKEGW